MRGRFIVLEGIDGSGKSSAVKALQKAMPDAWFTREETDTTRGAWVRQSIRDGMHPLATAFLFAADRAHHVQEIEARLDAGQDVVCDRYLPSTIAYQGHTLEGIVDDPVHYLKTLHEGWCIAPDRVIWLRASPAVCVARTRARADEDTRYEKAAFLEHVHAGYAAQATASHWRTIDAEQSPADVAAAVVAAAQS